MKLENLYAEMLKRKHSKKTMLIGIDGRGGAGKSTLADAIKKVDKANVSIVHMDDFYKTTLQRKKSCNSIGGLWDCNRVKEQVLVPLYNNTPTKYQIYDWELDSLTEWRDIPTGGVVIIEGCYSLCMELRCFFDFKIWVETPYSLRIFRGIQRDGEEKRSLWENVWMPAEEHYIKVQKPQEVADYIIDGTGNRAHIREGEVYIMDK